MIRAAAKRLLMLMGGGETPLVYLLRDLFTTPDSAPITSPRTCEPGPGTLTFVQTDGTQAISGGKHVFTAQSTPVWGDQGFYDDEQTRAAGLALVDTLNLTTWEECGIGWHAAAAVVDPDSMEHAIQANTANGQLDNENATPIATGLSASTDYRLAQILRSVGCFDVLDGALVGVSNEGATASLYPSFSNLDGAGSNDDVDVVDLPANGYPKWDADFSTVTDSLSAPASSTTFDHDIDCHARWTVTHETGKLVRIELRSTNANNRIFITGTSGEVFQVKTRNSGDETVHYNGVAALTDGVPYQVDVTLVGSALTVWLDNVLIGAFTTARVVQGSKPGLVINDLATNDIVLSTHPLTLGIATSRIIAPQAADTATHEADCLAYGRGVTVPSADSLQYELRKDGSDEITLDIDSAGKPIVKENGVARITGNNADVTDGDDWGMDLDDTDAKLFIEGIQIAATYESLSLTDGTTFNMASIGTGGATNSVELFPKNVAPLLPAELV